MSVLITFRVMPKEVDTDISMLSNDIKSLKARLNNLEKEPIAFGLVALKPSFIVKDASGAVEEIENKLKAIEGVGGVEVIEVSKLL